MIESAIWVGPFPSPLTGTIVAFDEQAFAEDVTVANRDPYEARWLARLQPERLAAELPELLAGETAFERYERVIEEEGIRCYRCAD